VKVAQSQIVNRLILSGLSGWLENENSTHEDVDQAKVHVERIIELVAVMPTTDELALIADPDPKFSIRAESQHQKYCEILVDHSRVLVSIKSVEENSDVIRSPMLLLHYPWLYGQCGR
jgi:hypothetical protein